MAKLKFNVVHSRCIGTDNTGKKQYVATTIGAVLEMDGRLVLKLNYLPPAGELCNLWAPKPKEEQQDITPSDLPDANPEGLGSV